MFKCRLKKDEMLFTMDLVRIFSRRGKMKNFTFYSPTFFAFCKDKENETGAYVKRFG